MSNAILKIEHLQKRFDALQVSDNVNIDLHPGEVHALIGPNGAGKSTLIALIAGSLTPDAGGIFLAGERINGLSVAARAQRGLGRCFQVSTLAMPLSVRRNVMIASQAISGSSFRFWKAVEKDVELNQAADEAIEQVGLMHKANTAVSVLSHGERRQVEVACALALKPRLLLLDEPMAGLGSAGSEHLTGILESLKQHIPILLIEHDMDAVFRLADRISVLVYGKIIAHGNADDIRSNPTVREAYLGGDD
jgi:branched-chain amino acid transport system ATP-binding protein